MEASALVCMSDTSSEATATNAVSERVNAKNANAEANTDCRRDRKSELMEGKGIVLLVGDCIDKTTMVVADEYEEES